MFTIYYADFKIQQRELYRQAEHYRLVKSLEKGRKFFSRMAGSLGRLLVQSGQQLINKAQAA